MSEVLLEFSEPVSVKDGESYRPRVCGRESDDGLWEGWIEFHPEYHEGAALPTPVESRQPDRAKLVYWATGLTVAYLEGALDRALTHASLPVRPRPSLEPVPETSPAPPIPPAHRTPVRPPPRAVLDPFEVYAQGEEVLRSELGALSPDHLRNIMWVHHLEHALSDETLRTASRPILADAIVMAVRDRTSRAARMLASDPGEAKA